MFLQSKGELSGKKLSVVCDKIKRIGRANSSACLRLRPFTFPFPCSRWLGLETMPSAVQKGQGKGGAGGGRWGGPGYTWAQHPRPTQTNKHSATRNLLPKMTRSGFGTSG